MELVKTDQNGGHLILERAALAERWLAGINHLPIPLYSAASIWVTAAIGILVGIGFWFAAIVGTVAVLVVLALFRFIETRLPSEFYAHHMLRFLRERVMTEDDLRKLIGDHGFSIANLSCRLIEGGQQFEYRMTIKSQDRRNAEKLSVHLRSLPEVVEFRIAPTGD